MLLTYSDLFVKLTAMAGGYAERGAEGRTVNIEVYKRTPFGKRYMDLDIWHNGVNLGGIETKVGNSRYLPLQQLKDLWLDANGYPVQLVRKPPYW